MKNLKKFEHKNFADLDSPEYPNVDDDVYWDIVDKQEQAKQTAMVWFHTEARIQVKSLQARDRA